SEDPKALIARHPGLSARTLRRMLKAPRRMTAEEIDVLLSAAVPARLATIGRDGFPHVTPLWFIWSAGAFYLTSISDRPHLRRLEANHQAGICVDIEERERDDGQRPNRQVRAVGCAELYPDRCGSWTARITEKYVRGLGASAMRASRVADQRVVISLRPDRLIAVTSV
ncbi:MAG TPA: pyridoxamine 5'-phosphate oxidase family protein, partial [Solirubrobacteraceae bacterium]